MRPRLLTFLTLLLLALAAPSVAHAAEALYPDLETLPPRNLEFDRTDVSQNSSGQMHNVLRFSNTVMNTGEGPVEIRATINRNLNPPSGPASQRVYDTAGGHADVALTGSSLYYHDVHVHYHFDHWGGYELWTKAEYDAWVASGQSVGAPDIVGQKTTSCVTDEEFAISTLMAVWPEQYPPDKCMPNAQNLIAQGLSTGWGDTYDYYRFEQWIDLGQGTLANGTYVLRSVTDPLNIVYESANKADTAREGAADNSAITTFTVSNGTILDSDAPTGTVTINHVDPLTTVPQVNLDVLGRDDVSGVTQFRVSNDHNTWKTYTNTSFDSNYQRISWDLTDPAAGGSTTTGQRTVCVMFKDATGKWGPLVTDTITYEPPAPPSSAYGQAVAADGPVGWWRLGETAGSTAANQVAGGATGSYAGGTTLGATSLLGTEAANKAVTFNGSTGRVTVPSSSTLGFTNAFSLEAWIKPTSLPASNAFRSVMTKAESYALQFNGPRLEFTVIQNGTRRRLQAANGAIVAGNTYHVVGTFDGSTQRLYLNGVQVASASLSGSATVTANSLVIGSWDGGSEFFNGTIDEPAVYNKVLSAARVQAHHAAATAATLAAPSGLSATPASTSQVNLTWSDNASGETGQVLERASSSLFSSVTTIALPADATSYADTGLSPATTYWYRVKAVSGATSSAYSNAVQATTQTPASYAGLIDAEHPVSYWRLDETSGTIAGDETVANPGTYVNAILGVPGLISTAPTRTAVGFNGTNGEVRVGQSGSMDITGLITLEAWIKPTTLPAAGSVRSILAKPGSYALQLNGPSLAFTVVQLGVRRMVQAPAGAIVAGRVYHVVGTFDGGTQRLYVNGTLVATASLAGAADITTGGIRIGSWNGASEFFAGTIDEPAVYGKVLSAVQVTQHFQMGQAPLGAPTDLTSSAVSSSRIDLAWTDNASAETAQTLQRSTSATFTSPTSIALAANAQSYADTTASPSTTYYYRVRASNASDTSAWSGTTSATTPAGPPPPATPYLNAVTADGPVGWWRLGEASGNTAANQAGGAAGTYAGTRTQGAASLLTTESANKAVTFNGSSGRMTVPSSSTFAFTNAFSLEAWIKPTSLPSSGSFRSVLTKPESYSLQFNGPRLEFTVIQNGTRRRLQAANGAVVAGGTYHVVGTFDGSTQRLYLNGVQVASVALSGAATVTSNALSVAAWSSGSEFFAGTVDEPAVYNKVLSAARVQAHYTAATTG